MAEVRASVCQHFVHWTFDSRSDHPEPLHERINDVFLHHVLAQPLPQLRYLRFVHAFVPHDHRLRCVTCMCETCAAPSATCDAACRPLRSELSSSPSACPSSSPRSSPSPSPSSYNIPTAAGSAVPAQQMRLGASCGWRIRRNLVLGVGDTGKQAARQSRTSPSVRVGMDNEILHASVLRELVIRLGVRTSVGVVITIVSTCAPNNRRQATAQTRFTWRTIPGNSVGLTSTARVSARNELAEGRYRHTQATAAATAVTK